MSVPAEVLAAQLLNLLKVVLQQPDPLVGGLPGGDPARVLLGPDVGQRLFEIIICALDGGVVRAVLRAQAAGHDGSGAWSYASSPRLAAWSRSDATTSITSPGSSSISRARSTCRMADSPSPARWS